jgi:hypothetical protein
MNVLNSLDTPAGHIIVCFTLILIGAIFVKLSIPKAEDLIIFALGTLGRSMLGDGYSKKSHKDEQPT